LELFIEFFRETGWDFFIKIWEHFYISLFAVILGSLVAVPLGVLLTRLPLLARLVMGLVNLFQTIPSFAILALMIPLLGVGKNSCDCCTLDLFSHAHITQYVYRNSRSK